jgi:hypothetical protein
MTTKTARARTPRYAVGRKEEPVTDTGRGAAEILAAINATAATLRRARASGHRNGDEQDGPGIERALDRLWEELRAARARVRRNGRNPDHNAPEGTHYQKPSRS